MGVEGERNQERGSCASGPDGLLVANDEWLNGRMEELSKRLLGDAAGSRSRDRGHGRTVNQTHRVEQGGSGGEEWRVLCNAAGRWRVRLRAWRTSCAAGCCCSRRILILLWLLLLLLLLLSSMRLL